MSGIIPRRKASKDYEKYMTSEVIQNTPKFTNNNSKLTQSIKSNKW